MDPRDQCLVTPGALTLSFKLSWDESSVGVTSLTSRPTKYFLIFAQLQIMFTKLFAMRRCQKLQVCQPKQEEGVCGLLLQLLSE